MVGIPGRVLIVGGSGVFGRLLAAEVLETTDLEVVLTGRDLARADMAARALDPARSGRTTARRLDLDRPGELRAEAEGCLAVACTAGPFQGLRPSIMDEALAAGASWIDIADTTPWVLGLLGDEELGERAKVAGLAVWPGLSTLPALSGTLTAWLAPRVPGAVRATVVLTIGNRNSRGPGAVGSILMRGVHEGFPVRTPLGRRTAWRIDSPEDRLPPRDGLAVTCGVALESRLAPPVLRLASRLSRGIDAATARRRARLLGAAASVWRFGTPGGSVLVELRDDRGRGEAAAFAGSDQRMAILPAAIVLGRLAAAAAPPTTGLVPPTDWLAPAEAIDELGRRGLRFLRREALS